MPFYIGVYAYGIIVQADQLLPQFWMEQFGIDSAFIGRPTPTTAFDGTI